jgi:hypothetical protein
MTKNIFLKYKIFFESHLSSGEKNLAKINIIMNYESRLKMIENNNNAKIEKIINFSTNINGTIIDENDKTYTEAEFQALQNNLEANPDNNWIIVQFIDEEPSHKFEPS